MLYFKYENGKFVSAPKILKETDANGKARIILTQSEHVYNKFGYYRKVLNPMPNDGFNYTEQWEQPTEEHPYFNQVWVKGTAIEDSSIEGDKLLEYMRTIATATTVKAIREAAQAYVSAYEDASEDSIVNES
jgi:hypothetical protein